MGQLLENRIYFDNIEIPYSYDGMNRNRLQATEGNETTTYIYSGLSVLYEETVTGTACYIYGPAGRLAKRTTNGETHTFYYHTDHLMSTRLVTDSNKNIVAAVTYHPFGEIDTEEGEESYLFTGKRETSTGLYYYSARYYEPDLGRFTTRDQKLGRIYDPKTLNRYTYCANNPLKYIDPDGRDYFIPEWAHHDSLNTGEFSWEGVAKKFSLWWHTLWTRIMARWGGWIIKKRTENGLIGVGVGAATGGASIALKIGAYASLGVVAAFETLYVLLSGSAEFYYDLWNNDPEFKALYNKADMYINLLMMGCDVSQEASDAVIELSVYLLQAKHGDDWRKYADQALLLAYDEMMKRESEQHNIETEYNGEYEPPPSVEID